MQTNFLFPNALKRIGWSLTLASVLIHLILSHSKVQSYLYQFLNQDKDRFWMFINFLDNYIDESVSILLIIGLNLVAFSKEKIEDEWVSKIRLQSLQWGVYINSAILAL